MNIHPLPMVSCLLVSGEASLGSIVQIDHRLGDLVALGLGIVAADQLQLMQVALTHVARDIVPIEDGGIEALHRRLICIHPTKVNPQSCLRQGYLPSPRLRQAGASGWRGRQAEIRPSTHLGTGLQIGSRQARQGRPEVLEGRNRKKRVTCGAR